MARSRRASLMIVELHCVYLKIIHVVSICITATFRSRYMIRWIDTIHTQFIQFDDARYPRSFRCLSEKRQFLGKENAAGEKWTRGTERERSRRGMQVSRCHGNTRRGRLWLPVTLPTGLARKEEERMRRDDEEDRAAPSKGESATRSSSHPAWCLRLSPSYRADGSVCWAYWKSDKKRRPRITRCSNIHHRISRDIPWKDLTVAVISYLLIFYCRT